MEILIIVLLAILIVLVLYTNFLKKKPQNNAEPHLELEKKISGLEQTKSYLEKQLAVKNEEITRISSSNQNHTNRIATLETENKNLLDDNNELKATFDVLNTTITEKNKKLEEVKDELNKTISEHSTKLKELEFFKENLEKDTLKINNLEEKINQLLEENRQLDSQNSRLTSELNSEKDIIREFKENKEALQKEFKTLADEVLKANANQLNETQKLRLEEILNPFKENVEGLKNKVEETYKEERDRIVKLSSEIETLVKTNAKVSNTAENLASALKGEKKKQGMWGEMVLQEILEFSGLQKDIHYEAESSFKTEEGNNQRPDFIVNIPGNRKIIIDSKVSLVAYNDYHAAQTDEEISDAIKRHIDSVKNHIKTLSDRSYHTKIEGLDFTMMFMPIEPAYIVAMNAEPALWKYAYDRKIILISPTNILAALRLIADLWRQDERYKNVATISDLGTKLLDKLHGFLDSFEKISTRLESTQKAYDAAKTTLTGKGGMVSLGERMKKLGVSTKLDTPNALIPQDFAEIESEEQLLFDNDTDTELI